MHKFDKPRRYTSEYRRGRVDNGKLKRNDNNLDNDKYKRLVEFQKCVGLRRNELKKLRGCDFVYDESGNPCVYVRKGKGGDFPRHLQNMHADTYTMEREQGYKYPHSYPNHWIKQQYLPDELVGTRYYEYGPNKLEQAAKQYWDSIKGV